MMKLISVLFITMVFIFLSGCDTNPYKHGEIMYQNFCASCHMDDGTGLEGNIPPLAGADYITQYRSNLACIIRYGIQDTISVNGITYNNAMPGVPQLTDFEIANILNYINHSWGNDYGFVTIDEVRASLEKCKQ